jgi:hypothetical protein
MSWLFSQALVEAYSADICSDGEQSAPLNGNHIQQAYCASDKMKDFSRLSRFGMTYKPLTDDLGAGVLTWCLAASLVRTFPQQEKAPESMEHEAECGDTWRESFARWDLDTSSWKTLQCSLLEGLDVFSETWPRWGMMRAGECSVQLMPVRHTKETEYGFWPTPTVAEATKIPACANYGQVGLNNHPRIRGYPTRPKLEKSRKKWQTPTCHNAKEAAYPAEFARNTPTLTSQAHGGQSTQPMPLNPVWVEWLMGWPLGWTDLKPLETDKFQAWQRSHGGY